jgi:hypothetical protein
MVIINGYGTPQIVRDGQCDRRHEHGGSGVRDEEADDRGERKQRCEEQARLGLAEDVQQPLRGELHAAGFLKCGRKRHHANDEDQVSATGSICRRCSA